MNVEVYQDATGAFHFQAFLPGTKNARLQPMLCGLEPGSSLRKVAWFPVADPRGRVHHDLACEVCRELLTI